MSDVETPSSSSPAPLERPAEVIEASHLSLSQELRGLINQETREDLTLKGLLSAIDEKAFGLLLVVLSLPSALPVPAAGYSVPFGICLLLLAVQMMMGKERPVFPDKFQNTTIKYGLAEKMIGAACKFLKLFEKFIKPRFGLLSGQRAVGIIVAIMALLMMVPIPSTNTFPAMVIFLLGVGLCEEDGLLVGLGLAVGIFAVLLYGTLIYFAITLGWEFFDFAKDWIKALLTGETLPTFTPADADATPGNVPDVVPAENTD